MTQEELIRKQREEIDALKKKLEDVLPESNRLNSILSAFEGSNLSGIYDAVDKLRAIQDKLVPIAKVLSGLDKETVKKILDKK